jgi:hypothetical protein
MKEITDIAKQLGSRGGKATKAKHGREHYVRLAENMNRKRAAKKLETVPKPEEGGV